MSQYLQFTLKNKENNTKLCLGYFCTTPARQIADTGAFPYTESETALSEEQVKNYLTLIREEVSVTNNYLNKSIKERSELQESLHKCVSKEVAEMLLQRIFEAESTIAEYTEELEDWKWRVNKIINILDIYEDNKDKWNLYYTNC